MDLEPIVREQRLLTPEHPVVVMYSGGRDSTCLLDVAVRIAGASVVTALHVNYGLRGSADDDERHCTRVCERLGVALEVRRPGRPPTGNMHAWARQVRYAAATALAESAPAAPAPAGTAPAGTAPAGTAPAGTARAGTAPADAHIAAGHTSTDQVESILYRLASSPSRRALLGMRPRDGRVIRPLLGFSRAHTRAHCETVGLPWREDETNADSRYARGRVRHGLVPALEAIHPAAQANVLALAQTLREEAAVLDELVDSVLQGRSEIALAALRGLAPALRRLVVQRLADGAAGGPAAGVGRRAEEVSAMPERGRACLDLPHGVRATAQDGVLRFAPTPKLGAPDAGAGA